MRIQSRLIRLLWLMLVLIPQVLIPQATKAESGQPLEILFVPWNGGDGETVGYRNDPDGRFGPQSFRVGRDGETVTVLDPLERSLKTFRGNSLLNALPVPEGSRDFLVGAAAERLFLADNRLLLQRDGVVVASHNDGVALPRIQSIGRIDDALVLVDHHGGRTCLAADLVADKRRVTPGANTPYHRAVRISLDQGRILRSDADGNILSTIDLDVPTGDLGGLRVVGADDRGRVFVDMNLIVRQVPLRVRREVWIVDASGSLLGRIPLPTHYFTRAFRDLELTGNGDLYHMISAADGLHVFRWEVGEPSGGDYLGEYPARFRNRVHYNFEVAADAREGANGLPSLRGKSAAASVTRAQAVANGDSYVLHQWTAAATNLSVGVETAPDGDLVETPDWIVVGTNLQVPYKWGGFDTLAEFDSGIGLGHFAGDIHTDSSSDYARGVDCSGYVSRCWELTSHYTTRMMDDPAYGPITLPYAAWADIEAGDAIHRDGHVRMSVDGLENGSFLVLESAGSATGWRVGYSTYTLAELEDYSPRYYIGMEGAPNVTTIVSSVSGSWTAATTWIGGVVPTSAEDVLIASGHTLSVDDGNAVCRSVFFGGDDALIDMNANSQLTVYGDFTLYSDQQTVFSAGWSSTSAFIKFAGSADQTLGGWSTSGGSTSFRDVIVDKDGGKLATAGDGMRLGIQNSLEIVNGLFELAPADDLEGRWASTGNFRNAELPDITIQAGGEFALVDGGGAHHIRSSGTPTPIGTVTVHGRAEFRDASSLLISLEGIDVEDGGLLVTNLGMGGGEFDAGPIRVKSGGELENRTTADIWGARASLTVDDGGLYDTKASTTVFPTAFTDNGRVRYSRVASTDQVITDRDYNDLEISLDTDNVKTWTLATDRTVADGLTVNNSGTLVLAAAAPQTLTVGDLLFLTSGLLDNSDTDAVLTVADGARVQRATGVITIAPAFAGQADLRYTSTSTQVTTGPEVPMGAGVITDFTVSGTQGVVLGTDITVNGTCTTEGSMLATDTYTLTLGPAATLAESDSSTVMGTVVTTRAVAQSVNEVFGGIGLEVLAAGAAPGATTVTRTTGTAQLVDGSDGILR
ncbi:MAG: hypothetical protein GY838_16725, partial [bacterium]|nr:hypothetical protein [bacterium]